MTLARSSGAGIGVGATLVALILSLDPGSLIGHDRVQVTAWLETNLGAAVWPFLLVLVFFVGNLIQLYTALNRAGKAKDIAELDQLTDVWISLFVGIGVVWTAIGMQFALQSALPSDITDTSTSAAGVLKKLVDGGVSLALTTTIVGAVGGYLMRLGKTLLLGADLHAFYAHPRPQLSRVDLHTLRTHKRLKTENAYAHDHTANPTTPIGDPTH